MKISTRGLRTLLEKFNEDGKRVEQTHWSIGRGGYDLWWELYYDGTPVVDCHASGKHKGFQELGELSNISLSDKDFERVRKIIISVYPECTLLCAE